MHSALKETNEKVRYYGDLIAYRALNSCANRVRDIVINERIDHRRIHP
jgi:hypothetical protein